MANDPIQTVDDSTFDVEVLQSPVYVAVFFCAPWSKLCTHVEAWVLQVVLHRYGSKLKVCKFDASAVNNLTCQRYGITLVPSFYFFKSGKALNGFGPGPPFDMKGALAYLDSTVL